ncbi:Heat shock protein Hsp20 [Propionibacterium freudenreichii]|jgi:HSP20 family protein|uniref:Hsp20/alpha crystallin family protein n=2 Tax=Actinomycetota TaxID=201174 RepID=UPI0003FDF95F|nr:Hsp20/alpha crystallin family protein [Propionibacterium freudenreichii]AJQ91855.1 Heat shock protein Hsp20 [Propionibacterium freudenreichii subsp. freudenreichii]AWY94859.1 Heat shock protein Hsp20 [Propionibacterium freudenreichii]MCT2995062.1 Hsp20/alpha crystallin family protein [Propionibacterium freudenreichii]MCT3001179.1 Hsp20/alpha crystallin family protein [Propionibacterium freudenreichii]MCT3014821.1 Hsp20/alpha crystallin family protein [Propionibacterium freudenreichii]
MVMALPVRGGNTEITHRDPFSELHDLTTRMNQLVQSALGDFPNRVASLWAPPVELEETEGSYVLEADLPGVKEDDVDLELRGNELSIHGEVKERERTGILRRSTRQVGQFEYRVTLPADVDPDQVNATLRDGVLRVEVAKTEATQPRRIQITKG